MGEPAPLRGCQAATQLARLIERDLGYAEGHISPVALRLFIQARWGRVSMLAHAIERDRGATDAQA